MIDHHHHRWNTESIANCTSTLEIPHKSCNDPHYSTNLHRGSALLYSSAWKRTWSITQPRNSITNHWHDSSEAEQSHGLLKRNSTNERPGGSVQASILSTTSESVHNWLATNQVFHCCPRIWFVECLKMLWPFLSLWEFVNPPPPPPPSSALHLLRDN